MSCPHGRFLVIWVLPNRDSPYAANSAQESSSVRHNTTSPRIQARTPSSAPSNPQTFPKHPSTARGWEGEGGWAQREQAPGAAPSIAPSWAFNGAPAALQYLAPAAAIEGKPPAGPPPPNTGVPTPQHAHRVYGNPMKPPKRRAAGTALLFSDSRVCSSLLYVRRIPSAQASRTPLSRCRPDISNPRTRHSHRAADLIPPLFNKLDLESTTLVQKHSGRRKHPEPA